MKFFTTLRNKATDKFYSLVPSIVKMLGVVTVWTRKVVAKLWWLGLVALVVELICRQWAQVIPTIAVIAASLAFTEAQKMRKSFKAWGFESGPGDVNKD